MWKTWPYRNKWNTKVHFTLIPPTRRRGYNNAFVTFHDGIIVFAAKHMYGQSSNSNFHSFTQVWQTLYIFCPSRIKRFLTKAGVAVLHLMIPPTESFASIPCNPFQGPVSLAMDTWLLLLKHGMSFCNRNWQLQYRLLILLKWPPLWVIHGYQIDVPPSRHALVSGYAVYYNLTGYFYFQTKW